MDLPNKVPYLKPADAAQLLQKRRSDVALCTDIAAYCSNDIPLYLQAKPSFVLPRHIATPNREAEYVIAVAQQVGAQAVLSQDLDDEFTLGNNLKRRLASPEISTGDNSRRPSYRKFQLFDQRMAPGMKMSEAKTVGGLTLANFHNSLFSKSCTENAIVADDAAWIAAHHRNNISIHFQYYMSLFTCYGVLFDDYESRADRGFRDRVILPAIQTLYRQFGVTPLIVKSIDETRGMSERWWLSHHEKYLDVIAEACKRIDT
jgi:hypothetical protein